MAANYQELRAAKWQLIHGDLKSLEDTTSDEIVLFEKVIAAANIVNSQECLLKEAQEALAITPFKVLQISLQRVPQSKKYVDSNNKPLVISFYLGTGCSLTTDKNYCLLPSTFFPELGMFGFFMSQPCSIDYAVGNEIGNYKMKLFQAGRFKADCIMEFRIGDMREKTVELFLEKMQQINLIEQEDALFIKSIVSVKKPAVEEEQLLQNLTTEQDIVKIIEIAEKLHNNSRQEALHITWLLHTTKGNKKALHLIDDCNIAWELAEALEGYAPHSALKALEIITLYATNPKQFGEFIYHSPYLEAALDKTKDILIALAGLELDISKQRKLRAEAITILMLLIHISGDPSKIFLSGNKLLSGQIHNLKLLINLLEIQRGASYFSDDKLLPNIDWHCYDLPIDIISSLLLAMADKLYCQHDSAHRKFEFDEPNATVTVKPVAIALHPELAYAAKWQLIHGDLDKLKSPTSDEIVIFEKILDTDSYLVPDYENSCYEDDGIEFQERLENKTLKIVRISLERIPQSKKQVNIYNDDDVYSGRDPLVMSIYIGNGAKLSADIDVWFYKNFTHDNLEIFHFFHNYRYFMGFEVENNRGGIYKKMEQSGRLFAAYKEDYIIDDMRDATIDLLLEELQRLNLLEAEDIVFIRSIICGRVLLKEEVELEKRLGMELNIAEAIEVAQQLHAISRQKALDNGSYTQKTVENTNIYKYVVDDCDAALKLAQALEEHHPQAAIKALAIITQYITHPYKFGNFIYQSPYAEQALNKTRDILIKLVSEETDVIKQRQFRAEAIKITTIMPAKAEHDEAYNCKLLYELMELQAGIGFNAILLQNDIGWLHDDLPLHVMTKMVLAMADRLYMRCSNQHIITYSYTMSPTLSDSNAVKQSNGNNAKPR